MTEPASSPSASAILSRIALAGILTGIIDGLFSSVLSVAFYNSTVERLFQGVASVPLGPEALKGGTQTFLIGLLMHFGVAFAWSILFMTVVLRIPAVRKLLDSPLGPLKVAAFYGPLVWMTMSLVVIPLLAHRPPSITARWWTQWFGHIPFVALPIAMSARGLWRKER